MTAAPIEQPVIRKGQTWLFEGQTWKVHDILTEGVIVLSGPYNGRDLNGVTAEELYAAGELRAEPTNVVSRKAVKLAAELECRRTRIASKPLGRPKKLRPPPEPLPWRVAVLAVDTATNSGWSIWRDGVLLQMGEVHKDRRDELILLCQTVQQLDRPAVLVTESAAGFVFGGRSASTLLGLGAAQQAWTEAWAAAEGQKSRHVHVQQTRWRGQLWGGRIKSTLGRGKTMTDFGRDWALIQLKRFGVAYADATLGIDACTAVCIGSWAVRAGEVGTCLPFKLRVHA